MKKYILALFISVFTITAYGQRKLNYVQSIANEAIISFPDTPRITTRLTSVAYEVAYYDIIYSASSYGVQQGSVDFLYRNFSNSLYRQSIANFIKTIHGKLIYKKDITVDGVKGIEFECHGTLDTVGYYLFYRSFYYNKKLISEGMWFRQEAQRNDARLNAFFSTFKFTGKAKNSSPWSDKALVIKGVKYAFIIILIIALVVGSIIFIAKRLSTKKIKE
jgi:hypothetical protein